MAKKIAVQPKDPAPMAGRPWTQHYDPGVPATLSYPDATFHALLDDAAESYPDAVATIFFNKKRTYRSISDDAWRKHEEAAGRGADDYLPGTYRLRKNLSNDYFVDRELQRTKTYTGISGLNTQDYAVQEGMGPIVDRSREHLGSSDKAIIAARRLLLDNLKSIEEGLPPAGSDPADYRAVRPAEAIIKGSEHWQEAMADLLEARW